MGTPYVPGPQQQGAAYALRQLFQKSTGDEDLDDRSYKVDARDDAIIIGRMSYLVDGSCYAAHSSIQRQQWQLPCKARQWRRSNKEDLFADVLPQDVCAHFLAGLCQQSDCSRRHPEPEEAKRLCEVSVRRLFVNPGKQITRI